VRLLSAVVFTVALTVALALVGAAGSAEAAEVVALSGIGVPFYSNKSPTFTRTGGGIFLATMLRMESGAGGFETGILRAGLSAMRNEGATETRSDGSYWIVPVLYRLPLHPPFFHLAIGADYAFGDSTFKSHPGLEAALQAQQDLGNDYGVVLDIRFREGLGTAFSASGQTSGIRILTAALGFQKRLE
jgi:hypothetical protein